MKHSEYVIYEKNANKKLARNQHNGTYEKKMSSLQKQ